MLGIIGGTGFSQLPGTEIKDEVWIDTPFGETSGPIISASYQDYEFAFLARHGNPHKIPPHLINYRANLHALKNFGATQVIAINAVGGIHPDFLPGSLAIPHQIIDYTYGREHTIYDGVYSDTVDHVDFTHPYSEALRLLLIESASKSSVKVLSSGIYGATQGPRLESSAEIVRCKRDGCDMVGMTGMPEAAIARELSIDYACLAMSVNWAAGLSEALITMGDIRAAIETASVDVINVLLGAIASLKTASLKTSNS